MQLYMVCDGVGGLEKGEVASKLTCETISNYLLKHETLTEEDIDAAVLLAEKELQNYIAVNREAEGMATTLTLLATHHKGITIAHIGDSRIYHIREGDILLKTFDHSFVNELVTKNIISEQEALNHPNRNVVTKAIMAGEHQNPEIDHISDIRPGDYFFLCTDGVLESVSDMDLMTILNDSSLPNLEKLNLIKEKCKAASKDNFSAYLLQVNEVSNLGISNKVNAVIWSNPKIVMYTLLGALMLTIGLVFWTSSRTGSAILKEQIDKVDDKENSLEILESIDIKGLENSLDDNSENSDLDKATSSDSIVQNKQVKTSSVKSKSLGVSDSTIDLDKANEKDLNSEFRLKGTVPAKDLKKEIVPDFDKQQSKDTVIKADTIIMKKDSLKSIPAASVTPQDTIKLDTSKINNMKPGG